MIAHGDGRQPLIDSAVIDTTLWDSAFSGKARSAWCKHCFSISYSSKDCYWEPELPSMAPVVANTPGYSCSRSVMIRIIAEEQDCLALNTAIDILCNCVFHPICSS